MKPGDEITIRIDGREVVTTIDGEGVQRLPENRFVSLLMDNRWNELAMMAARRMVSQAERQQIYEMSGYSVAGFAEVFPNAVIENPLWRT